MPTTHAHSVAPQGTLQIVGKLFESLHAQSVSYCHWKSNESLGSALAGVGDLDILVSPNSADAMQSILHSLGFKLAKQKPRDSQYSVHHYFGVDEDSGYVVHVHMYYRLITCGLVLKNYHLPLEKMLLAECRFQYGVRVPTKSAELAALVVRKMVEAGAAVELLGLLMEWRNVQNEMEWLLSDEGQTAAEITARSCELVEGWLPSVPIAEFLRAMTLMRGSSSPTRHYWFGKRFRRWLRPYTIHSTLRASAATFLRVSGKVLDRMFRQPSKKRLHTGGKVVAIVGPDASGKSTVSNDLCTTFGRHLDVRAAHLGKPPSTLVTFLPNLGLPILRKLFPTARTKMPGDASTDQKNSRKGFVSSLVHAVRACLNAHDRYRAALLARRAAASGCVVVCDRYPVSAIGATDGIRIDSQDETVNNSRLLSWLGTIEARFYRAIPDPDLVLALNVPCDVAVTRNQTRIKQDKEDEAFIRHRHSSWQANHYYTADLITIDTNCDLQAMLRQARGYVWKAL